MNFYLKNEYTLKLHARIDPAAVVNMTAANTNFTYNHDLRCTRCRQKRPVCEAQLRVKTTKDRVAGEPSKKCKRCAESEKLVAQQKRLASHFDDEEDKTMYNNLGSFPSLARWRKLVLSLINKSQPYPSVATGYCYLF